MTLIKYSAGLVVPSNSLNLVRQEVNVDGQGDRSLALGWPTQTHTFIPTRTVPPRFPATQLRSVNLSCLITSPRRQNVMATAAIETERTTIQLLDTDKIFHTETHPRSFTKMTTRTNVKKDVFTVLSNKTTDLGLKNDVNFV